MKVVVIIPAAGLGTRMAPAGKSPVKSKQFEELHGVPILIRTLRAFTAAPQVNDIYIALRKEEQEGFQKLLAKEDLHHKKVHLVEGGEHRQNSVASALEAVRAEPEDVVLVHDAVRPFVSLEIIQNVIEAAGKYGAAIAGVPAVDTIKQVDRTAEGARIHATIPREHIVQAQTPQGFRFGVLQKAFQEAQADGFTGTDEASLLERSGHEVAVVMGSPRNLKITTPGDLELAEFLVSQEGKRR